jgi:PAS domain S-box-containing protein
MNQLEKNAPEKISSDLPTRAWTQIAKWILVAMVYWLTVRLGLLVVARPEGVASIWPASGLALAVLLLSPSRHWTGLLAMIFLTNVVGNFSGGNSLVVSLGFALANSLEPLLGAWVLTRFLRSRITFDNTREIFFLFGVALVVNALTALLGALVTSLAFGAPYFRTWLVWWTSNGLGIILVTPLIITWSSGWNLYQTIFQQRFGEAIILFSSLTAFAWLLFGPFTVVGEQVLRIYMIFPFLIWLAFRFRPRGMSSALTLLAAITVTSTMQGFGIFATPGQSVTRYLVSAQIFLAVISFSGLLLVALVTERRLVQQALIESEDKFKYVFDHSVVGKSFTLPSGEINVNQAFCDLLGYSSDELKDRTWQEISHPDDLELTQNAINALLSGEKESIRFMKRYLHKNGSVVWTELGTALRRDKNLQPLYFMTTILDITERKLAEDALKYAKEYAENLIQTANTMVVGMDTRGNINVFNQAAEAITGYTLSEIRDRNWFEVIVPRDRYPQVWEEFLRLTSGGLPKSFENPILTKNCQERYIVWQNNEVLSKGTIMGTISFGMDITERKQAEESLRETTERLTHMISNSPTVIYALEVQGDQALPTWISENIEKVLGFSLQEALQRDWWLRQVYPLDLPEVRTSLEHLFDDFYQQEYRFRCKDGHMVWLHDEHRLFRDAADKPLEIIGSWTDISASKKAEESLRDYNLRLEVAVEERTHQLQDTQEQLVRQEKLAVLGQLAGGVGHELRNPLSVINNSVYYLKLVQPDAEEKVRQHLAMIEQEVHTAEKIISDLLDFARIKSVDREPTSVPELVQNVLTRYPVSASIQVTVDLPPHLPQVFADPRQVEQVLGNLVVNACQAMVSTSSTTGVPKGSRLTLTATRKEKMVAIAVQDTGVGIPPENMAKLFEPLFTTKAKGIGLGLAVSRKLAEANEGRIEVESEPGKGSTFTLYLPESV